jgi:hypothetical protein
MRRRRLFPISAIALALTAAAARSRAPDDPAAPIHAYPYRSVTSGTKSYRPVEPLPWGGVNRRVAPKEMGEKKNGAVPQGKGSEPEHKH